MKKIALLVAVALAAIWWLFFNPKERAPLPSDIVSAKEESARAHGQGAGPTIARPRLPSPERALEALAQPAEGLSRVFVFDREKSPVGGATVYAFRTSDSRRLHAPRDFKHLGVTGPDGWLDFDSRTGTVIVYANGYQPCSREVELLTKTVSVELAEGCRVSIRCSTRDGAPIPGVFIALSAGALADAEELDMASHVSAGQKTLPGGNWLTAIHAGVTGLSGEVVLEGLPPVHPTRYTHTPHYVLVGGWPRGRFVLDVGDNQIDLQLDPILIGAARIVGDELLTWSATLPNSLRIPMSAASAMEGLKKPIIADSADTLCMMVCPSFTADAGYVVAPRSVDVQVLTSTRGWVTAPVVLQEAASFAGKKTIDVSGYDPVANLGEVTVRIRNPRGDTVIPEFVRLRCGLSNRKIPIRLGEPLKLPAGDYSIEFTNSFLSRALMDRALKVEENQNREVVLALQTQMAAVRLRLKDSSGLEHHSGTLRLTVGGISLSRAMTSSMGERVFWVPEGRVKFEAWLPGCEPIKWEQDVEAGTTPMVCTRVAPRTA